MSVPPPPPRLPADGAVTVLSAEEWKSAAARELSALGLTYQQLEEQHRDRNFSSTAARKLWMSIGGTL